MTIDPGTRITVFADMPVWTITAQMIVKNYQGQLPPRPTIVAR
jgi:hypothetical protein